jgi:hypothetical protein
MEAQKKSPKDFGLMVRESPETLETTLLVTARNKMRNTEQIICQLNYGGVYADTSKLLKNAAVNKDNYSAFTELYESLDFQWVDGRYMARGIWKQQIADFISKLKIHYINKKFDIQGLSEYIADSDIFTTWDVVIAKGDSTSFTEFMNVKDLPATTRSFHTSGAADKFIRIGGNNNRVLDPSILDSGLSHLTKEKKAEILAKKNIDRRAAGKPDQKELTATDYLKEREHPILVIYPIELKTEVSPSDCKARFGTEDATKEQKDEISAEKKAIKKSVCDDIPLMAFAVAFPAKESSKKFTYRANLQKLKELTDNLEVTDDEEGEDDNDG